MKILSVVVGFNTPTITTAIHSLVEQRLLEDHVIVVWENGARSSDVHSATLHHVEAGKRLYHFGDGVNYGYAPAVSRAWNAIRSELVEVQDFDIVHLCNPDAKALGQNALRQLSEVAEQRKAIVGPAMVDGAGRPRPSAYPFMRPYNVALKRVSSGWMTRATRVRGWGKPRYVDTLDGSYLIVPMGAWGLLDGLDPHYFLYSDDHDFCLRASYGGVDRWFEPTCRVEHLGGTSRAPRQVLCALDTIRCSLYFCRKFYGNRRAALARKLVRHLVSRLGRGPIDGSLLAWWAQNAPYVMPTPVGGIELSYVEWLSAQPHPAANALQRLLDCERGNRDV